MSDDNLYAPPVAPVGPGPMPSTTAKPLARRMSRLAAQLVDNVGLALLLLAPVVAILFATDGELDDTTGPFVIVYLLGAALGVLVVQLLLLHRHGQTIGKMLVGVRIVRVDGSRAALGRLFGLRWLLPGVIASVPVAGPIFSIADVLFIFRADRRCLHDLIADTIVVEA